MKGVLKKWVSGSESFIVNCSAEDEDLFSQSKLSHHLLNEQTCTRDT